MIHATEAATDFSAEKVACYCMLDTDRQSNPQPFACMHTYSCPAVFTPDLRRQLAIFY